MSIKKVHSFGSLSYLYGFLLPLSPPKITNVHRVQSGSIECLGEMGVHAQNSQVRFRVQVAGGDSLLSAPTIIPLFPTTLPLSITPSRRFKHSQEAG